jgi:transposase
VVCLATLGFRASEIAALSLEDIDRRRIRGRRERRLMRRRGERIERSYAHLYETRGMRRTHLRGHQNILKRLLIHTGGFNLGLLLRTVIGVGTPRGLQGGAPIVIATLLVLVGVVRGRFAAIRLPYSLPVVLWDRVRLRMCVLELSITATCATGC